MGERPTKIKALLNWRAAIASSDLPPTRRHVALTLSLWMNERGASAFPGATRLANDTGLNVSTVREHLNDLVRGGWLTLVEKGGVKGARRRANHYAAMIPAGFVPRPDAADDDPGDDPSSSPTGRAEPADPSSSPRQPLVLPDPISSRTLDGTREAPLKGPPTDTEKELSARLAAEAAQALREGRAADLRADEPEPDPRPLDAAERAAGER